MPSGTRTLRAEPAATAANSTSDAGATETWILFLVDDQTYAFNIHQCFYLDILNYYGAPELTPAFCKLDDYLMMAMPESIQWGRTQTIGMGAEYCNFRWDYIPVEEVA